MSNPKLTVAITYHNEKIMLTQCITSLLGSEVIPDEVIVFDDASDFPATDFIPVNLRHSVRVIRSPKNVGQGMGRNLMASSSIGDYIHFHDCDDSFTDNWTSEIRRALTDKPDVVISDFERVLPDGSKITKAGHINLFNKQADKTGFFLCYGLPPIAFVYKLEFFNRIGKYQTRDDFPVSEDEELNLRVSLAQPNITVISKMISVQNWRKDSSCRDLSGNIRAICYEFSIKAATLHLDKLQPHHIQIIGEKFSRLIYLRISEKDYVSAKSIINSAKQLTPIRFKSTVGKLTHYLSILFGPYVGCRISAFIHRRKQLSS